MDHFVEQDDCETGACLFGCGDVGAGIDGGVQVDVCGVRESSMFFVVFTVTVAAVLQSPFLENVVSRRVDLVTNVATNVWWVWQVGPWFGEPAAAVRHGQNDVA